MEPIITSEVVVAYSQCPRKAHLLMFSPDKGEGMNAYLVLLGIRQACRFQDKSFFKFLFSGETGLDKFEAHKRKR